MRICDYIAHELYRRGVRHIYGLMGGGASGLNDGFIKHGSLKYICFHNEQGAGHAALGEAKLTGNISVVNPTTGCGGTNCITSLLSAWQDSVPVVFISGNVSSNFCTAFKNNDKFGPNKVRKYGIQEHNIIDTVKSITKFSVIIKDASELPSILDQAIHIATTGRKGPVWIDIPSDIQTAKLPDIFPVFNLSEISDISLFDRNVYTTSIINDLIMSDRPIVLVGQGIKQSKTRGYFLEFVETHKIPFVTTYGASDISSYTHPLHIGSIGIKGTRAANFAMQNADFLLTLGCSLNNSHIGYDIKTWSPKSKKYIVNIDDTEIRKYIVYDHEGSQIGYEFDHTFIHMDLVDFFKEMKEIL